MIKKAGEVLESFGDDFKYKEASLAGAEFEIYAAETIYTAEVDLLMQGKSYQEVLEYMEEHDKGMPDDPFGMKTSGSAETEASVPEPVSGQEAAQEPAEEAKPDTDEKSDKE